MVGAISAAYTGRTRTNPFYYGLFLRDSQQRPQQAPISPLQGMLFSDPDLPFLINEKLAL